MPFDGAQNVKQQLRDARQILIERGWCIGHRVNTQGERCALGALDLALGHEVTDQDFAVVLLAQATGEKYVGQADYHVAVFNNQQGDVLSVLNWFDRAYDQADFELLKAG